jgi:hypothetical protein
MIKFFRKIRQNLLIENKPIKYLRYAIGEIILVVIGILIALQINDWNQNRLNKKLEKQYLASIIIDLKDETKNFNSQVFDKFQPKIAALLLAKKYYYGNYTIIDTVKFIKTVGYGGVFSNGSNFGNTATYQELISSSNFKLLENETIKKDIINYYGLSEFFTEYYNNVRTDYATYNNSLNPYNPNDRDAINSLDIKRTLESYKSEKFLNLINQELTFGYSIKRRINELDKLANELILKIEKEINQHHD